MMRFSFYLLGLTVLLGCVPVTENFYLPLDRSQAYEGKTCGSVPYGGWHHQLTSDASIGLTAIPKNYGLIISIQIALNPGTEFQFLGSSVSISMDSQPPLTVPINLYGAPQRTQIETVTKINGINNRLPYFASAEVAGITPKSFLLQFPDIK